MAIRNVLTIGRGVIRDRIKGAIMCMNKLASRVAVAALFVGFISGTAQASTCPTAPTSSQDYISLSVAGATCATGNSAYTPQAGYVSLEQDTFNVSTQTVSGTFSVPSGYSSLELIFSSGSSLPHPDDFDITLPWTAAITSITWNFLNNSQTTGANTHIDYILTAALYGLPNTDTTTVSATPLPSTWMMLLSGFVGFGFVAYRQATKRAGSLAAA